MSEKSSEAGVKKVHAPQLPRKSFSLPIRHIAALVLIAGVALAAYSNTFSVPFQFDDRPNIVNNPDVQIKVLTWDRLEQLVKNTYKETIRVFSFMTLALNYYFGAFDVFGYHGVNLLIHIASGIFLYVFLLLTFNLPFLRKEYGLFSYRAALFASLIFIAHPVQTQAVTYIVQRMASMAGMFYLLSMVLYVKGRLSTGRTRLFYFIGLALSYLLGVFTKENVAILPLFVALYEVYFFQKLDLTPKTKKIVLGLASGLLLLAAFGFVLWGKRYIDVVVEGYEYRTFTMSERLLTQVRVVLHYLTLLIYPHPSRLNLDYDFPISGSLLDPPSTLISLLVILFLIGYGVWVAKKRPVLSYFLFWYFGNLVIESSIFPLEMVHEHRLYLPSAGPFLLFSLLLIRGMEKLKTGISFRKHKTAAVSGRPI
jgi:hypothetical protein